MNISKGADMNQKLVANRQRAMHYLLILLMICWSVLLPGIAAASSVDSINAILAEANAADGVLSDDEPIVPILPADVSLVTIEEYDNKGWLKAGGLNYKVAADERSVTVSLTKDEFLFFQKYLRAMQQKKVISGITVVPVERKGEMNCLVLQGETSDLKKSVRILNAAKKYQIPPMLVGISVMLQRITISSNEDIGTVYDLIATWGYGQQFDKTLNNITGSSIAESTATSLIGFLQAKLKFSINQSDTHSEVLLSGDVYTHNGQKTVLKSEERIQVITRQSADNFTSTTMPVKTNISVLPTVVSLDQNIGNSQVLLDMDVAMSMVSGKEALSYVTVPTTTSETLVGKRMIKANSLPVIAGILVADSDLYSKSGLPYLGDLPVLGDFATANHSDKKTYSIGILTVSAKLLPL